MVTATWALAALAVLGVALLLLRRKPAAPPHIGPSRAPSIALPRQAPITSPSPLVPEEGYPNYRIEYADENGEATTRDIYVYNTREYGGDIYYDAYCFLRKGERTFREDRMQSVTSLATGRRIKSIRDYERRKSNF